MKRYIVKIAACCTFAITMSSTPAHAQIKGKFSPPYGKMLFIAGQDLGAIGGFKEAPNNDGYSDHFDKKPGGVTFYTNLPALMGMEGQISWGAGDVCGQCIVENPVYKNSALAIGLYVVDHLKDIAQGNYAQEVTDLGKWIKSTNRPVYLRFGYEFDGAWNHYDPKEFQEAFRYVSNLFKKLGVDNCAMVWHSGASPVDDKIEGFHEDISTWYPGDEYVDYVGYSWFLPSQDQVDLTDEVVNFARAHKKPVMVCESSPQGYDLVRLTRRNFGAVYDGPAGENLQKKTSEEIWNEWYVPFFNYIEKNKDIIQAVAYIDCNWDVQQMWGPPYKDGYWGDARVEANDFIKKKWLETVVDNKRYLHSSPELFKLLNYTPPVVAK